MTSQLRREKRTLPGTAPLRGRHLALLGAIGISVAGCEPSSKQPPVLDLQSPSEVHGLPVLLDLGGPEAEAPQQFYQIRRAFLLRTGDVAIADGGSQEIRLMTRGGHFVRRIGRRGEGPGEFRQLTWAGRYAADSIAAFDYPTARVSIFDGLGNYVRSFSLPRTESAPFPELIGAFDDGSFVVSDGDFHASPAAGTSFKTIHLSRYSPDGRFIALIDSFPGTELFSVTGGAAWPVPYGRRSIFAAVDRTLFAADTYARELRAFDATGSLIWAHPIRSSGTAVSAKDVERYRGAFRRRADAVRNPASRSRMLTFLDNVPFPDTIPSVRSLVASLDGTAWVGGFADEHGLRIWTIVDRSGFGPGQLRLPITFSVLDADAGVILAVMRDSLDVEHVLLLGVPTDSGARLQSNQTMDLSGVRVVKHQGRAYTESRIRK